MTDTDGTFITLQAGAVAVVWWHYLSMRFRFILAALAPCASVAAQDHIPVRHLGPIVATSTENVGATPSVRVTSSGTVLVGSDPKQRVWVLDSTLRIVSTIRDSTEGTASRGVTNTLVPYLGDSTLMPDVDGTALVVIDPAGKRARVMAPPRVADIYTLAPPSGGHSGVDNGGRLIYRGNPPANAGRALRAHAASGWTSWGQRHPLSGRRDSGDCEVRIRHRPRQRVSQLLPSASDRIGNCRPGHARLDPSDDLEKWPRTDSLMTSSTSQDESSNAYRFPKTALSSALDRRTTSTSLTASTGKRSSSEQTFVRPG
jgi:hypothetical protein